MEKTNVVSGKVFLAERRAFYNIHAKFCLNNYPVLLCSRIFLLFLRIMFTEGPPRRSWRYPWLVSHGGTKTERGCARSEQRQTKRGRGATKEQPWHKKK